MNHPAIDPTALLQQFSGFLARQMGLYFPKERHRDLWRAMQGAAAEFKFSDPAACMTWLQSGPLHKEHVEILARHLTVGETYFFRDPHVFEALRSAILPALIQARRESGTKRLRLWSAGCASGEEAYTLAILLLHLIPDYRQWNITLLATDINPVALARATAGIYGEWSFRNAPDWLKSHYFRPVSSGRYQIDPAIRQMVSFSFLNLMEGQYPSLNTNTNAMDIVFCRNVLMYFEPRLADQVVERLRMSLVDSGWLIASPTEISHAMSSQFETVNFPGAILHRKGLPDTALQPLDFGTQAFAEPLPPQDEIRIAQPISTQAPDTVMPPAHADTSPPDYRQAFALYQQGRYQDAAAHAQTLLRNQQYKFQGITLMARIYANQGDLAQARHWCMQATDMNRLDPVGHYLMAIVLLEQGHTEGGMQELKRTLYIDPDFVLAHVALGNLYRQLQRPADADRHFRNALQWLHSRPQDEILPESDGMTAGNLTRTIEAMSIEVQTA